MVAPGELVGALADLGGPLLRDRLWFFGAYDRVTDTRDNALPACKTNASRAQLEAHDVRDKVSIVADNVPYPP